MVRKISFTAVVVSPLMCLPLTDSWGRGLVAAAVTGGAGGGGGGVDSVCGGSGGRAVEAVAAVDSGGAGRGGFGALAAGGGAGRRWTWGAVRCGSRAVQRGGGTCGWEEARVARWSRCRWWRAAGGFGGAVQVRERVAWGQRPRWVRRCGLRRVRVVVIRFAPTVVSSKASWVPSKGFHGSGSTGVGRGNVGVGGDAGSAVDGGGRPRAASEVGVGVGGDAGSAVDARRVGRRGAGRRRRGGGGRPGVDGVGVGRPGVGVGGVGGYAPVSASARYTAASAVRTNYDTGGPMIGIGTLDIRA